MSESVRVEMSGVYAVLMSVVGIALPLTHFLSANLTGNGFYLSIFHIYLYGVSLLFLFYIQVCLCSRRDKAKTDDDLSGSRETLDSLDGRHGNLNDHPNMQPPDDDGDGDDNDDVNGDKGHDDTSLTKHDLERKAPCYCYHGEGISLFLRVALIVFGMGSAILDGFRLLQFAENSPKLPCQGKLFMTQTILRIIFLFAQTFFLFKYHKLLVNFHRTLIRLGLLHLVATNVGIWAFTIVLETTESYSHILLNNFGYKTPNNIPPTPNVHSPLPGGANINLSWLVTCHTERSLADKASFYLYPCVIQFCIIAAATSLSLYRTVGCTVVTHTSKPQVRRQRTVCHKANTGLFLGLLFLVAICVTACFFLMFHPNTHPLNNTITMYVYVVSDVILLALTSLAVLIAFLRFHKFQRSPVRLRFNRNVLTLSVIGYYALAVFLLLPSCLKAGESSNMGMYARFQVIISVLSLIQATAQVGFLIDGGSRVAADRQQRQSKPGRSVITFLLMLNLAMCVVNTLEVKEIHTFTLYREFYGELAWQMIVHICLPLTIFFRFQSAVCLSEIWLKAYKKNHAVPRITRIYDPDSTL